MTFYTTIPTLYTRSTIYTKLPKAKPLNRYVCQHTYSAAAISYTGDLMSVRFEMDIDENASKEFIKGKLDELHEIEKMTERAL